MSISSAIRYSLFAIRVLTKKKYIQSFFLPFKSESRIANREWQSANDKFCLKHKCLFFSAIRHSLFRREGIFLSFQI